MATWVIGDVHGCERTFLSLLQCIGWDRTRDRLWLTGDLVNRGPRSLAVLRWVAEREDRVTVVLGNHDLYLIARALGVTGRERRDTLEDVLRAPDRHALVSWLRWRPLVHVEGDTLLVHAGLWPTWDAADARRVASRVSERLRGRGAEHLLRRLQSGRVRPWDEDLGDDEQIERGAAILTNIRAVNDARVGDRSGIREPGGDDPLPWFEVSQAVRRGTAVVFGHWARLGHLRRPGVLALDSGCVWGGGLTAVRLDDGAVVTEPTRELPEELPTRQETSGISVP